MSVEYWYQGEEARIVASLGPGEPELNLILRPDVMTLVTSPAAIHVLDELSMYNTRIKRGTESLPPIVDTGDPPPPPTGGPVLAGTMVSAGTMVDAAGTT